MTADVGVFHTVLRKVNRQTMRLAVPAQFIKAFGLQAGDHCTWIIAPNGDVRLKFVKTTEQPEAESA